jgi:dynein heavy chain
MSVTDHLTLFYRFTNHEDKKWFENALNQACQQQLGEEYLKFIPVEPYFVDFLREAPEATGEEGEDANLEAPKIYEQVYHSQLTVLAVGTVT